MRALKKKHFIFFVYIFLSELLGDILKQKPSETDGVESVVVIDGVPQVEPERLEKLQSFISKVLGKFGTIVNQYYPKNENGYTKGLVIYIVSLYKLISIYKNNDFIFSSFLLL